MQDTSPMTQDTLTMAKPQKKFVCQECGYTSPQWLGKCPNCDSWNTFIEEISGERPFAPTKIPVKPLSEIKLSPTIRMRTQIHEFDRVLGGGLVEGSLVLVGGEPGIGKSTLLLQAADKFSGLGKKVLYISGEESLSQLKLRAERFVKSPQNIFILAQTNIEEILSEIDTVSPDVIVVDSVQTLYHSELDGLPGSITQVRECALRLMGVAKSTHIPIFIIGHVTKEGFIAGPRTLEHMVDTVLYLEGDKNHFYRILRAAKNRFGSTHEIGVFEMKEGGMDEVNDPSLMFLGKCGASKAPGNIVTCAMEGTRPFLVEIQSLLAPCVYRIPQRVSAGIDYRRLSMLLAVIERRLGLKVSAQDVFINVVGGLTIEETASDLALILAIVSGLKDAPVSSKTAVLGEVGLGGEVRSIPFIEKRLKEIERLGFTDCLLPSNGDVGAGFKPALKIIPVSNVRDAIYEAIGNHSKL